jgi:hypothetical protein
MKLFLSSLISLLLTAGLAFGQPGFVANLVSSDAAWPTGAAINSGNPGENFALSTVGKGLIDYEAERDVKNQRTLSQSFSVGGAGLNVTDLYIGYVGGTNITDTVQIRIFEVEDVHGLANSDGNSASDDLIFGFPVTGPGTLNTNEIYNQAVDLTSDGITDETTFKTIHLSVDGITLPAQTGPAGYLLSLYNPDTDGVLPFKWAIERDDTALNGANAGPYLGGRAFGDNDGSHEENHDWAFAIQGTPIPEPAATGLILIAIVGGFALLRRRF